MIIGCAEVLSSVPGSQGQFMILKSLLSAEHINVSEHSSGHRKCVSRMSLSTSGRLCPGQWCDEEETWLPHVDLLFAGHQ